MEAVLVQLCERDDYVSGLLYFVEFFLDIYICSFACLFCRFEISTSRYNWFQLFPFKSLSTCSKSTSFKLRQALLSIDDDDDDDDEEEEEEEERGK